MMRPGSMYKHKRNTDVAMEIVDLMAGMSGVYVTVVWYNIVNPENVHMINPDFERHFISFKDVKNWEEYHARV